VKNNMNKITGVTTTPMNGWVTLTVTDVVGDNHYMDVKQIDLDVYEDGALIQDAFPYLTLEQRELIITGLTEDMWNDMFGDEPDWDNEEE